MASVILNSCDNETNERILPPYCTVRDDIVISGISGIFPDAYDINEFAKNLYNGVDCVNGRFPRWSPGKYEEPKFLGNLPTDLSEFDNEFFGYTIEESNNLRVYMRIALEHTQSAILDSGTDPETLRGKNIGVFMANSFNENPIVDDIYSSNLKAQLISYSFDFRGPASSVDTACASTLTALHQAMVALRTGQCVGAVIVATNITLHPIISVMFDDLSMLSHECKSKPFDANADGYGRSETIGVIFLQKKRDAKRIYSIIRHSKSNADGYKSEGITFPNADIQAKLITETYRECGIDPLTVKFMESHATGTKAGDPIECRAITKAMRMGKHKEFGPLMIGAVKSNVGHSEAASGMCAIVKVIIAYENKMIPKNINLKVLNPDIPELHDGSLLPVTENTPFDGGIVSVNNFGFGGANIHVIMESPSIEPNDESFKFAKQIPRLVLMCGRTLESVKHVFEYINSNRSLITNEFLSLINDISHQSRTKYRGMPFRGSMILHNVEQYKPEFQIGETYTSEEQRQLWFIFTGIGSQWSNIDLSIMKCDIIAHTISKLSHVLQPYDIDLVKILTSDESFLNPINYFISIVAIQIAFVELLINLGIKPNKIIGHSIGEITCAYADGVLSDSEAILTAYCCGKCIYDLVKERGLMAEIGLSLFDAKMQCPSGIVVACNNSSDSVIISGPYNLTVQFLDRLRHQNTFVKELYSCDVPLHSPRMELITESLMNELNLIGIKSKSRTEQWISTSCDDTALSDVMYYVNNLIKPVKFYEAIQRIPENACVIEISPHSSFESTIKKTVGSDVKFISMMTDNGTIDTLLSSIGQLYGHGYDPQIEKLYPTVEYPVPRGTPFISPLIKWDHSFKHYVPNNDEIAINDEKIKKLWKINLNDPEYSTISDHIIDGRILFPGTGYIYLIWKTLAEFYNINISQLPMQFEDVSLIRATIISVNRDVNFIVHYFKSSGKFQIEESGTVCVSGRVFVPNICDSNFLKYQYIINDNIDMNGKSVLNSKGIYKEFTIRGMDYGPSFQCFHSATFNGHNAKIKFTGNWISLLDSLLQLYLLLIDNHNCNVPKYFELMRCDPRFMVINDDEKLIDCVYDPNTKILSAPGIESKGFKYVSIPRKMQSNVIIQEQIFVPNNENMAIDNDLKIEIEDYIIACHSIVLQIQRRLGNHVNYINNNVDAYLLSDNDKYTFIKIINEILKNVTPENYKQLITKEITDNNEKINNDFIFNESIYNIRILQPLVYISITNYMKRPFKILEINNGYSIMSQKLIDIMKFNLISNYKCTVAHSDKNIKCKNPDIQIVQLNLTDYKIEIKKNEIAKKSHGLIVIRDKLLCGYEQTSNYDIKLMLKTANYLLDDNGFIMAFFRYKNLPFDYILYQNMINFQKLSEDFMENAKDLGLITICKKYDGISTMAVLLRKPNPINIIKRHYISINNESFNWIDEYKHIHNNIKSNEQIWLLANDAHSGIIGLGNCIRSESKGECIRCVYNEQMIDNSVPPEIIEMDLQNNVFRDGKWGYIIQITKNNAQMVKPIEHAYVKIKNKGDFTSFAWFEAPHKYWPIIRKDNETLVNVYYSALNFKDVMIASGRLSNDVIPGDLNIENDKLGLEFSGKDENGNRIMGIVSGRGMATTVVVKDTDFLWSVPNEWTMEEACTVPCVYSTSYYALLIRAKLNRGESVLIHSGTGGVGQSAIAICLSLDCEVFTTVGSPKKRDFIKMKFQLKDDHIFNSRDTKFESQILQLTNGRGVDVVLNSLSEDKLLASVRCLATNGRFCEIGKFDASINNQLDLSTLIRNKTFHGIYLDSFHHSNVLPKNMNKQKMMIRELISEGIANGVVMPLDRTVFDKHHVEDAFRFMSKGNHMGKVIIKIRDENHAHDKPFTVMAYPRTFINPKKSIIITGGLGGFGLEMAQWLVKRGARKLILTSRTGPKEEYHYYAIERMKNMGADVKVWKGNGTSEKEIEELLMYSNAIGAITAIFHLAMVFRGSLLENQNIEDFSIVANTKILQAQYLDRLTRRMCPQLDYFVVFSSTAASKGEKGHSSYAFGNSACERICESRRNDGFHGLAIQWGPIGDVGIVAEVLKMTFKELTSQRIHSCIAVLDQLLQYDGAVYGSYIPADENVKSSDKIDIKLQILNILGLGDNYEKIDPKTRLIDLGIDSINILEIQNVLKTHYNLNLSSNEIRNLKFEDLKKYLNTKTIDVQKMNIFGKFSKNINFTNELVVELNIVKSGKPLFFLQSSAGMFTAFLPAAQRLARPVYGINWTEEFNTFTSVEQVAEKWMQTIEEIEPMDEYDIIGYSFGGYFLMEIALQLQKRGRKIKNLIMIDAGHKILKFERYRDLEDYDIDYAQIQMLYNLMDAVIDANHDEFKSKIINESFDKRFTIASKYLKEKGFNHSERNILLYLEGFWSKLLISYKYHAEDKYDGDVILIRIPKGSHEQKFDLPFDYGISELITGKCHVHIWEGTHMNVLERNPDKMVELINNL